MKVEGAMGESIKVKCGGCSATFSILNQFAGSRVKCPKCGAGLRIPGMIEPPPDSGSGISDVDQAASDAADARRAYRGNRASSITCCASYSRRARAAAAAPAAAAAGGRHKEEWTGLYDAWRWRPAGSIRR